MCDQLQLVWLGSSGERNAPGWKGWFVVRPNPGRRGLGREVHIEIRRRIAAGESWRFVAAAMDVSMETIRQVLRKAGPVPPRWTDRTKCQLSLAQREEIMLGLTGAESFRGIAVRLGVAPSTISREVNNNGGRGNYRAWQADARAYALARRDKPRKLVDNTELAGEVNKGLIQRWSPEELAGSSSTFLIGRRCTCPTKRSTKRCSCRPRAD